MKKLLALLLLLFAIPAHGDSQQLTYGATVGRFRLGILTGSSTTAARFFRYTPSDPSTTSWHSWFSSFDNGSDPRNQVHREGWNIDGGGARVDASANMGALAEEFEQRFGSVMERHSVFVDPGDVAHRFLSSDFRVVAPYTARVFVSADTIVLGRGKTPNDNDGAITISPTETQSYSPDHFKKIRLEDDAVNLEAGTTSSPTCTLSLSDSGDIAARGARGFLGVSGSTRFDWASTYSTMYSPDGQSQVFAANSGVQILGSGVLSLWLTNTFASYRVSVYPNAANTYDNGLNGSEWRSVAAYWHETPNGNALTISSNTITPTTALHSITSGGLVKTITVPKSGNFSGSIKIHATVGGVTYDGTGNILVPSGGGSITQDRMWEVTWNGSKWVPSF